MKERLEELETQLQALIAKRNTLQSELTQVTQEAIRVDGALSEVKSLLDKAEKLEEQTEE